MVRDPATGSAGAGFAAQDVVLVAEIVSPSNAVTDLILKRSLYAAHGIEHYWIVDIRSDPVVHLLSLIEGRYAESTVGPTEARRVTEPFAVTIRPVDLAR